MSRTCAYSPIYIFLCTVLVTLRRLGHISYHFDDSRTLQYNTNTYMLDDQPFLIDSTTFLSQCKSHDHNWSLPLTLVKFNLAPETVKIIFGIISFHDKYNVAQGDYLCGI